MIRKLNHQDPDVAKKIRAVFQVSYAVEAKLLNAIDFPPLKRTLDEYLETETQFYGFWKDNALAAVVEIKRYEETTHIQSLVVDPKYFRQGIAHQLTAFVFNTFDSEKYMVETGLANKPAVMLYKKHGFKEVMQYDTDHGIRKIRLESKGKNK